MFRTGLLYALLSVCFSSNSQTLFDRAELIRLQSVYSKDTTYIIDSIATPRGVMLLNFHFSSLPIAFSEYHAARIPPAFINSKDASELSDKISLYKKFEIGEQFPQLVFSDTLGNQQTINFSGNSEAVYLIDFWASWCPPCRGNAENLVKLNKAYASRGLRLISISVDEDEAAWRKAITQDGLDGWLHLRQSLQNQLEETIGVSAIPVYYLLDSKGLLIGKYNGRWKGLSDMEAEILRQIKE